MTILTYQRYKFRLYRATSNLTADIYSRRKLPKEDLISKIERIHCQIVEIWNSIPPELQLSSFKTGTWRSNEEEDILRVFQLQAVSLQLLYDNIQLILHRPLLQFDETDPDRRPLGNGYTARAGRSPITEGFQQDDAGWSKKCHLITISRNQMWESAMRTSWLGEQPHTSEWPRIRTPRPISPSRHSRPVSPLDCSPSAVPSPIDHKLPNKPSGDSSRHPKH